MFTRIGDELGELIRKLRKSLATLQDVPAALISIIDIDEKSTNGLTLDPNCMRGAK